MRLLDENRFARIWEPTPVERDARQLLLHRAKQVRSGEEPVAGAGVEPGCAAEVEIVECERTAAVGKFAVAAVGPPPKNGVAGAARSTGSFDRRTGWRRYGAGPQASGGAALDDPSGSGADRRTGVRADAGTSRKVSPGEASGQLFRADSHGAFPAAVVGNGWDTSAGSKITTRPSCWIGLSGQ
jgi:hypothetical protein